MDSCSLVVFDCRKKWRFKPKSMPRNLIVLTLCLLALTQTAIADTLFTYTAGTVLFDRNVFPAQSDQVGQGYTGDLNGDGAFDVIISAATFPFQHPGSRGPQTGLILFNNGDNSFTPALGDQPQSEHAREYLVYDFNGDKLLDIYIADHGYDAAPFPGFRDQLLLGTGTGFTDATNRLPDISAFTHNGAAGDIDGDGDIDIFALNSDGIEAELSYFLINDGLANFTLNRSSLPASLNSVAQLKNSYAAEISDLDADGFPELIIGRRDFTNSLPNQIHWNDGQGNFSDSRVTYLDDEIDVFNNLERVHAIDIQGTDVNGASLNDLLIHSYASAQFTGVSIQLYMNQGGRKFVNETQRRLGSKSLSNAPMRSVPFLSKIIDVNGDGIADLVSALSGDQSDDSVVIFEGTGAGCFNEVTLASLNSPANARFRLAQHPVFTPQQQMGFIEMFNTSQAGQNKFHITYVPIDISAKPAIANRFSSCSGILQTSVSILGGQSYAINFTIEASAANIVLRIDPASLKEISTLPDKFASFDASTGKLTIPELAVDGNVAFRNIVLALTDAEQLLFTLESAE